MSLWCVFDNARLAALGALWIAETLALSSPTLGLIRRAMVLKLTIEYDGSNYSGWQLQPRHDSIQGRIEAALERIFAAPVRVFGSGRTDAGVHARGQVASISIPRPFDSAELQRALNSMLPADIVVLDIAPRPTISIRAAPRARACTSIAC